MPSAAASILARICSALATMRECCRLISRSAVTGLDAEAARCIDQERASDCRKPIGTEYRPGERGGGGPAGLLVSARVVDRYAQQIVERCRLDAGGRHEEAQVFEVRVAVAEKQIKDEPVEEAGAR